jgi:hypothetical protein
MSCGALRQHWEIQDFTMRLKRLEHNYYILSSILNYPAPCLALENGRGGRENMTELSEIGTPYS